MSLITNRQARFEYDILDRIEAGISLTGSEVRSLRNGHGRLDEAYASFNKNGSLMLKGLFISPYQASNPSAFFESDRQRQLLLTKKELSSLEGKVKERGITIIPLSVYTKGRFLKVELAVVRGRKKFDKRSVLKKRDAEREIQRTLKHQK